MDKIQRKATKLIKECAEKTFLERLEITGLTTLECRRTRADLIEFFKILTGFLGGIYLILEVTL